MSLSRLIERFNPGVTLLVAVWTIAFELRRWLEARGTLTPVADEALLSLLFVVPIMLVGWAAITIGERRARGLID
jgi:hypothetical protein